MVHSTTTSKTGESPSPVILKRKRSKRYRTLALPPSYAAAAAAATAASSASSDTTEEDHDMADCLMLLAQGPSFPVPFNEAPIPPPSSTDPATVSMIYYCKSCTKCFPSFQALGGHRASHRKPDESGSKTDLSGSTAKPKASSSGAGGGRQRTHKCSVCRAEFSSGQALGGHMRRHRPALLLQNKLQTNRNENKALLLDLNLPAPDDDGVDGDGEGDGDASQFLVFKY